MDLLDKQEFLLNKMLESKNALKNDMREMQNTLDDIDMKINIRLMEIDNLKLDLEMYGSKFDKFMRETRGRKEEEDVRVGGDFIKNEEGIDGGTSSKICGNCYPEREYRKEKAK